MDNQVNVGRGTSGSVLCSSAVRNAIEHDKQVNKGLSSCASVCTSAMKGILDNSGVGGRGRGGVNSTGPRLRA